MTRVVRSKYLIPAVRFDVSGFSARVGRAVTVQSVQITALRIRIILDEPVPHLPQPCTKPHPPASNRRGNEEEETPAPKHDALHLVQVYMGHEFIGQERIAAGLLILAA